MAAISAPLVFCHGCFMAMGGGGKPRGSEQRGFLRRSTYIDRNGITPKDIHEWKI